MPESHPAAGPSAAAPPTLPQLPRGQPVPSGPQQDSRDRCSGAERRGRVLTHPVVAARWKPPGIGVKVFVRSRRSCYSSTFCLGGWLLCDSTGRVEGEGGAFVSRCLTNMPPVSQESARCVKSPGERRTPTDDLGAIAPTVSCSSHVFHQPRPS